MLENRKIYESNLEAQLAQWKAEIDVLKAKVKRAEVGAKVQYDQSIDTMQRKHDEAAKRLRNLKAASDDAWEGMKTSTEKVWTEFKALFQGSAKTL
jgi:DNA-binding transcriptional regulator GbsR (MarR family)